jgi:hypothetical protein
VTEFIHQTALVSETSAISESELTRASAALQKQLTRDFGPIWDVRATIGTFARLEDVPRVLADHRPGRHPRRRGGGAPRQRRSAVRAVQYSNRWTLTAGHELLEMSADPFGNRLIASRSVKRGQGRVQYLVEVADPSEGAEFGYHVNGVLVSDFYTPQFFDPVTTPGTRYSFTGAIKKPRQVLRGGYLSWHHPPTDHWWQQRWFSGDKPVFKDLGVLQGSEGSIRAQIDRLTPMRDMVEDLAPRSKVLTEAKAVREEVDQSTAARARTLRAHIDEIKTSARG